MLQAGIAAAIHGRRLVVWPPSTGRSNRSPVCMQPQWRQAQSPFPTHQKAWKRSERGGLGGMEAQSHTWAMVPGMLSIMPNAK